MSFFTRNARQQFLAATSEMLEVIAKVFPECAETKEVHLFFKNVTTHSDAKIDEAIEAWFGHLQRTLNTKKIKYAKAVERLTGEATVYHAMAYRDIDALKLSVDSGIAVRVGLFEKWGDARLDTETKNTLWDLLDMITKASLTFKEKSPPAVPTREQIQENIKQTRTKGEGVDKDASMLLAFRSDMSKLCALWEVRADSLTDDAVCQDWIRRWAALTQEARDGLPFRMICANKNSAALSTIVQSCFAELSPPDEINEEAWEIIARLNDISTVVGNIPSGMMTQIESMAARLAGDLQAGRIDMSNIDLSSLGEQVLSQCSESDMSKFAGNLGNLMPVVQSSMQSGMQQPAARE